MRRTVGHAPLRSTYTSTSVATPHTTIERKPEYTPVFSMLKRGKYASYVTYRDPLSDLWRVHLCENEACAHAGVHICSLPIHPKTVHRPPCARCGTVHNLTWHHIYPQRYFKRFTRFMQYKLSLCRDCHDDMETYIPERRILPPHEYLKITLVFLRGST